jgi:hypothetical protein
MVQGAVGCNVDRDRSESGFSPLPLADQLRLELDIPESNVESAGGFAGRVLDGAEARLGANLTVRIASLYDAKC